MKTYELLPERGNLHGHFSRDLPPILTIDSGDCVIFKTLDAAWNVEPRTSENHEIEPKKIEPRHPVKDRGHCLVGPIAVCGAEPGMTLRVHFEEIVPASTGWTFAGGWESAENIGLKMTRSGTTHLWQIDVQKGIAINQKGHRVPIRPFLGVIANAPDLSGINSTTPPRWVGGNMDCRELIAGSTLYLPIDVPGANFSLGDGHAAQGDGEVSGIAIEAGMDRVVCTFEIVPDLTLTTPRAETPAGLLTLGFHENLNEATMIALNAMLDWMVVRFRISREDALALASVAVDLRITQIVNQVRGVHALLPAHLMDDLVPA